MRKANPRERYLIWLAFLTGMRRIDLLGITRWDCKKDYLHVTEDKTGKRVRIEWTPSLHRVIDKLLALSDDYRLFPVSDSAIDTAWQRLRTRLAKEWPGYELFQLKDLRAESASEVEDAGGDATKQLGHSSRALTQKHYLRKGRIIKPVR